MRPARRGDALSGERDSPSRALVVATMMLGTISTILSATIVNVAFPALIAEFHVGHDTLQWIAAGVALGVAFILWERRAAAPLLPIRLFGHRTFVGASIVAFAYGMGLFGSTYLVPVFAQQIAHYDAAEAGYLLAPAGVALAIAIAIGGRLTDRLHARPIIIAGLALFAVSTSCVSWAAQSA